MDTGFIRRPESVEDDYVRKGYWTGAVLSDIARDVAATDPGRTAIVTRSGRMTFGELDARADRVAAGFDQLGIACGDNVVLQLPNGEAFFLTLLGLFRIGARPVLALPAHRETEIGHLCDIVDATAYITAEMIQRYDHRDLARKLRVTRPGLHVVVVGQPEEFVGLDDLVASASTAQPPRPIVDPRTPALFLLSGGTTSLPKLIPRTHDDYAYQMRETALAMGLGPRGAYLAALPVAHNAALGCPGALGALLVGATAVLSSSPSPDEAFSLIEQEGPTLTTLMPAFLSIWAELAPEFDIDLSALVIEVGGAPLTPQDAATAEAALGCTVSRWFGMAEGLLCFTRVDDPDEVRLATEGRPLCPDDELRVVDESGRDVPPGQSGELLTRGPYTLRGYYRAPDHNSTAFTEDGFLRTGDLVRLTEAGDLVVTGRIKDVVNRAGEKVSSEEVEGHLSGHPAVDQIAIVSLPDRGLGELSCAVLVPRGEAPALSDLRGYLTERGVAEYKAPDRLVIVEQLPRTSLGKVDKAALRADLTSGT